MKRLFHAYPRVLRPASALAVCGLLLSTLSLQAQETEKKEVKDPFGIDVIDRPSASTPLTYGLILNFAYPVYQVAATDFEQPEKFPKFDAQIYIDAWQLGYARRIYGDVFQFTARTVGRDVYSGWFAEYGTSESEPLTYFDSTGNELTRTVGSTVYALGMRAQSGYKNKIGVNYLSNVSMGLRVPDDDAFTSTFFISYQLGIGGRMPLPFGAVQLSALGDLALLPEGGEPVMILGISLGATVALNLQAD